MNKTSLLLLVFIALIYFPSSAQDVYIDLNNVRQPVDAVGFCHEGDRQYGNYYVLNGGGIQDMINNGMTLFRDMLPNKLWESYNDDGNPYNINMNAFNTGDDRVKNSFLRLKEMQNRGITTILGIWDVPNWMVTNPGSGSARHINNLDEFAEFIAAYCLHAKNAYGLTIDYIDINETSYHGINIALSATEYASLIIKTSALFQQHGIQTKMNIGSVLKWQDWYLEQIYNTPGVREVAGYPAFHSYRGGDLSDEDQTFKDWGAFRQRIDRNLWCTETGFDAYYWENPDRYTWQGVENEAKNFWRTFYQARASTAAGWFWRSDWASLNVNKAYMRYFKPGGAIVGASQPSGELLTLAYKNVGDNKVVLQVLNMSNYARNVNFYGVPSNAQFQLIRTSEAGDRLSDKGNFSANGSTLSVNLQANSFNTFIADLGSGGTDQQSPTAPANFALTSSGTTSASLSWSASSDNVGVVGYDIYTDADVFLGSTSSTSITLNNLSAPTNYTVVVKAFDAAGNYSAASNAVTFTTGQGGGYAARVFQDCAYGGYSAQLQTGTYNLADLQALGVANDDISSVEISSGYQVTLYMGNNSTDQSLVLTNSNSCLVANGFNDETSSIVVSSIASSIQIEAEDYNNMSGIQTGSTTDVGGGSYVGWIDANDWMSYPYFEVPQSGNYSVAFRVASLNGGGSLQFEQAGGTQVFGSVNIPSTGGWQTWTTVYMNVNLNAGNQGFGIKALSGGWNINWWSVTPSGASGARKSGYVENLSEASKPYSNPFSDQVIIPVNYQNQYELKIYTLSGSLIWQDGFDKPGKDRVIWKGVNDDNHWVPGGVYFYQLNCDGNVSTGKLVKLD
ncbi:carbohydrate-binding protein [Fulvivirga ligni]|uniref:carbohydrate-binding protein n=1 Tax=Fulvivirga ligni TaxID=2904246 RepID=UPI001F1E6035|nr:carbohydrate-binding protein [Fulvivirga ligni]UII21366.1 carbohydrate-binding protein [Fulvivirga ligni]